MGRVMTLAGRPGLYVEFWHPARGRTVRRRVKGTRRDAARILRELETAADRERLGLDEHLSNDVEIASLIKAWHAHLSGRTRSRTWESYALGLRTVLGWLEPRRRPRLVSDLRLDDVEAFAAEALSHGLPRGVDHGDLPSAGVVATAEELACLAGVVVNTVYHWRALGLPVRDDGAYDAAAVRRWREARAEAVPLSARSVAMRVGALVALLRWAEEAGRIARNPLGRWKAPRGETRRNRRPLTEWEIAKLLEASPADLGDVWRVALATGLRAGELTSLEWDDVEWEAGRLRVRAETSKSKRTRHVPMGPTVEAILRRLRLHLAERSDRESARRLVFTNTAGGHWQGALSRRLKPCLVAAGLREDIDLHTLRHTYATHLISRGVDPRTVQELLGHATMAATEIYTHALATRVAEAADVAEGVLTAAAEATQNARRTRAAGG